MRLAFRVLSILLDYPSKEFKELAMNIEDVASAVEAENPKVARLLRRFVGSIKVDNVEELFVSLFELPANCSLYVHEYLLKGKEDELGRFLLELKGRYKLRGYDMDTRRELPDYIPVILEFMSLAPEEDLRLFAKRYLAPVLPRLEKCLSSRGGREYLLLVEALKELIDSIVR
ncbi:MAG: nitrate reductase molybdenum cofactor assembly chaperone [Desulfurococcales archaeon]|nr:nitrate reductase molybdenum cofactor assembly chaperone [Desulfurococcales archaeon]